MLVTQAVAIWKVHATKGYDITKGGFEYNLVLIALLAAVGLIGPGMNSLDRYLGVRLPRPQVFLAALGVVALVVGLTIL